MSAFSRRPLRVLHIGPDRDARGGIASLLRAMTDSATSFKNRGISLQFVSTTQSDGSGAFAKAGAFLHAIGRVLTAVLKPGVDIVHIHTALKGSLIRKTIFAWICYLCRMPYIFQIHNGGFFDRYSEMTGLSRLFVCRALKNAACVIVLSQHMRELALQSGAVSADRCVLVYNGILDPLRGDEPGKGQHTGVVRIVFLGLLSAAKGVPTLLDAIEIIQPNPAKLSVTVYGSGGVYDFKNEITDRGLSHIIAYGGWVGLEEKNSVLKDADIFVLPSKREGFSVAVLEAMAHGLAIVSTSIPGVVDAVRNDIEAILVPSGDVMALAAAIRELGDDQELRLRLGLAARQRYLTYFTLEKMADELGAVYFGCAANIDWKN